MKYQWLLILVLLSASIGCAKLGQTTITEDLLGEQSAWLDDAAKITDLPVENEESEEADSVQEQGETIDLADQKSRDISVKLTAKPQKKLSDQPVPVNPINCGHSLECDCQNFKKPPKLLSIQPANPLAAIPPLALDKHPLTPLNREPSGEITQARNNNFNSLRSLGPSQALGPLEIQPKSQLQPMASQVLSPSISLTTKNGLGALPQQTPEKQPLQPTDSIQSDKLTSLTEQPCENCDKISCSENCPNSKTSEDQGWDKLFAIDTTQNENCPGCESGLCETKDLVIAPKVPIVITEPPFEIAPATPLPDTRAESKTSPRMEAAIPSKVVDLEQSIIYPKNPNRLVNGLERENRPKIEHAFRPPAAPISESPTTKLDESRSNDFIPNSKTDSNPKTSLPLPIDEKSQLEVSIQKLKSQLDLETDSNRRNALEVNLQLFEFLRHQLANDGTLTSITVEEKKYWEHQLEAIEMMAQGGGEEVTGKAADATLGNLRKAMSRLESIAELQIKNGAICFEIGGFGKHKSFPKNLFKPGQPILVYCEVENYESKDQEIDSKRVVQSRFQGSYQIENGDGQQVQSGDFPVIEDNAPQRRRDFYLYFKIKLNELEPGNYRLQMEIEDLNGQKTGNLEQDLLFIVQ
ncbi:MAG: hypothetical protein P8R31_17130 [Mariniblastus sp.]|nr:hypothetical protein [Mariniblastus sp.]